ncbi:unnamed protein product [Caenorhabditis sp. 36 PRJEB53466]|nr:unnamed protein product [Caenorhabditis sp. 36 PRJEB53466]
MKLAIMLIVGGIASLCATGYLAYMEFAETVYTFLDNPKHYRLKQGIPQKELRFIRRNRTLNGERFKTEDERLRNKVLYTFNSIRKIVASGRIDTLMDFVKSFGVFGAINIPMGPAANMMELEWSNKMEAIVKKEYNIQPNMSTSMSALKSLPSTIQNLGNTFSDINIPGYHGFRWDFPIKKITAKIKEVMGKNGQSGGDVSKAIDKIIKFGDFIEILISVIYIAASYPKDKNISGEHLGPASALVAQRHEIGCWSNKLFAICLVRKDNATEFYKEGVTCTECPQSSRCEYVVQPDDSLAEGDVCIFDPEYEASTLSPKGDDDADNGHRKSVEVSSVLICVLMPFLV